MEAVLKVLELFVDLLKEKKRGIAVIVLLLVFTAVIIYRWEKVEQYFRKPDFSFVENSSEEYEVVRSDMPLKSGEMLIQPQIVVKYQEIIVYCLNIKNYYQGNWIALEKSDSQNLSEFKALTTKQQRIKLEKLQDSFFELLKESIAEKELNCDSLKVYTIRLADLKYQPLKGKREHKYWYFSDADRKEISEWEVRHYNKNCWLDLELYKENVSIFLNQELMDHVERCLDEIEEITEDK